jgi:hypothetical protein
MPPILSTSVVSCLAEHALVKGRHQRRTLAACRHIAAAQVGDDGDAGQLGQQGGALSCSV